MVVVCTATRAHVGSRARGATCLPPTRARVRRFESSFLRTRRPVARVDDLLLELVRQLDVHELRHIICFGLDVLTAVEVGDAREVALESQLDQLADRRELEGEGGGGGSAIRRRLRVGRRGVGNGPGS